MVFCRKEQITSWHRACSRITYVLVAHRVIVLSAEDIGKSMWEGQGMGTLTIRRTPNLSGCDYLRPDIRQNDEHLRTTA